MHKFARIAIKAKHSQATTLQLPIKALLVHGYLITATSPANDAA